MDQANINKSLIGVALILFAILSFLSYKALHRNIANGSLDTTGTNRTAPTPTGIQLSQPNINERPRLVIKDNKVPENTIVLAKNQMVSIINKNASDITFLPPTGLVNSDITLPDGRLYEMKFEKPGKYNLTLKFNNSQKDVSIIVL